MDHRSPAFEANLLYKTAPNAPSDDILKDIKGVLEAHETMLGQIERVDEIFTLIQCETLEILLAFTDIPMPVDHFKDVKRPQMASVPETEILRRLTRHQFSVTVLVVGRNSDTAGPSAIKNSLICRDIVAAISNQTLPDLIYWSEQDILGTADEFNDLDDTRPCFGATDPVADFKIIPGAEVTCGRLPHFDPQPCWDIIEGGNSTPKATPQVASQSRLKASLDVVLAATLPSGLIVNLDQMVADFDRHRLVNIVSMVCASATIGISSLQNLSGLTG